MQLKAVDGGQQLACITSQVNNGKSLSVPGVSYVAAGIAGAALAVSGLSALASAGNAGAPTHSPTFGEVIGWFQAMSLNGMMSVQYPGVYQSWSKNFAFSTGLIKWEAMQTSIDGFRNKTGGNLTEDSVAFLKNATLVHVNQNMNLTKRGLDSIVLWARDELQTNVNGTESAPQDNKIQHTVKGIQGYVEELAIPDGNTFMTVLLIFAIVIAAITVGILLFKVILESWALCGNFPKRLTGFRKRYWWTLAKTITNLILLLYGIWTLYCVYQFKNGDSWAAKLLAGVTLGIFTGVLAFFTYKIWSIAHKFKKMEGDSSALYDNKEVWHKYSIFYENYKKSYWWIFVPAIVYMFARGCVIAGADGHGLVQAAGQLIVEALLLVVLLWTRPFSLKSGNWINIVIQVVRVLSVVCILVFVEELGVAQTTKTVTGLVLVVMQAVLTGLLAILIAVNAIIICCRDNPHRKKRKEAGKLLIAPFFNIVILNGVLQKKCVISTISLPSMLATPSSWILKNTSAARFLSPSQPAVATNRCRLPSRTQRMGVLSNTATATANHTSSVTQQASVDETGATSAASAEIETKVHSGLLDCPKSTLAHRKVATHTPATPNKAVTEDRDKHTEHWIPILKSNSHLYIFWRIRDNFGLVHVI
jgi:hypothetical protein